MPVAGGVDEGVGDGFARAEALYQRRGVVERVGVGAVGVQGQGSVKPGLGNLGGDVYKRQVRVLVLMPPC